MELAVCAIVLVLASSHPATATPHGYGVKNGPAAQAVAGASAGAFAGAAGLPIALPHGAGFSGSYSKSASSSFASSSASSSASSFSFSGSGLQAPAGGCTSSHCQNGDANGHAPIGNVNGLYSNNGANALAGAQAGAFAGSQSFNKDGSSPCSGINCPNQNGADCKGPNCSSVLSPDNKCESGKCESSPSSEPSTYNTEPNNKCTSGHCETSGLPEVQDNNASSNNDLNSVDGNKCSSGNCGTTSSNDGSSSSSFPSSNCASGQCGPSSEAGKPSAYGSNSYANKPDEKCTSGQCEPSSDFGRAPSTYGGNSYPNTPKEKCSSGQCGPSLAVENYGENSSPNSPHEKCTSGQCGNLPANDNLSQNYDSPNEKCKSGQCNSNGAFPSGQHNSYDIPVNIASSASVKPAYNLDKAAGSTSAYNTPGCSSGNCGKFPSSGSTPSYAPGTTNSYSRPNYSGQNPIGCDSPDCSNGAYNPHAAAPGGASFSSYDKPVTYLTAPKQDTSCTSPNCQSSGTSPGYYPSGSIVPTSGVNPSLPPNTKAPCSNGNCGHTQPPSPSSYSVPLIPNQPNSVYRPSGPKCTTLNCDLNTPHLPSNTPQTFGTSQQVPYGSGHKPSNIPHDSIIHTPPSHGYNSASNIPNGPSNYPTTQPIPQNSVSGYKPTQPSGTSTYPNYSFNQPTSSPTASGSNNPKEDDSIPPFVALTPPKASNCGGSLCPGNTVSPNPSIPAGHPSPPTGSKHPGTYNNGAPNGGAKNPERPYQGGFGAPSGILKPNDYSLPTISTTNSKPTTTSVGDHSIPCSIGNCNAPPTTLPQYGQSGVGVAAGKPSGSGTHNPAACSTGSCGPQNGPTGAYNLNGANSAATAAAFATADAVAYSGGFGGPPGLLKPFDDGKLTGGSTGLNGKTPSAPWLSSGHFPTSGDHSTAGNGALSGAGVHAVAAAGATAGAFGGSAYNHSANGGHQGTGGCGGGCNGGAHTKGGHHDDLHGGISGAGASAKSISFGSSFASAHASSGAATKGGYGR